MTARLPPRWSSLSCPNPRALVCIANVGDSRAYIVAAGVAQQISDDHSIVAARVAAGQITAAEARTAPDRNVLTRSIGSEPEVLVDIFGPRQLQPNERLLLCTDGVHGMIDDAAIGRLASSLPIGQSAGALVAAAVEAGGRDNATALVGGYGQAAAGVAPLHAAALPRSGHRPPVRAVVAAMLVIVALALVAFVVSGGFVLGPPHLQRRRPRFANLKPEPDRSRDGVADAQADAQPTPTPTPHADAHADSDADSDPDTDSARTHSDSHD